MKKWVGWSTLLAMLVVLWWFVLPPQLGGRTTMLTTHGISMEPYVHTGDVAVLHKSSHYKVGDVIAYHSDTLNTTVMHRIISVDANGITTKGDNNSWVDLDHPTNKHIYGRLDHLFKGGGKVLALVRSVPVRMLGAALCGLAVYYALRGNDDRIRSVASKRTLGVRNAASERLKRPLPAQALPYVLASGLAFSVGVTSLAFTKPVSDSNPRQVIYNLNGYYNYSATTGPGGELAYPDGQVSTGDTIYQSLVKELFVTYAYRYDGLGKFHGSGTVALNVVLKGKTGWNHKVVLSPAKPFSGDTAYTNALIDLKKMSDLATQVQSVTKVKDGGFTMTVQGVVTLHGSVAGQPLDSVFTSGIDFVGDANTLKSQAPNANDTPGKSITPQKSLTTDPSSKNQSASGYSTAQGGTLTIPAGAPARLKMLGLTLGILALRILGLISSGAFAVGLALVLWRRRPVGNSLRRLEEEAGVSEEMVVAVTGVAGTATQETVVEVASLSDLARIADRFEMLILQEEAAETTTFVVNHETTTYRYVHRHVSGEERFGVGEEAGAEGSKT